MAEVKVSSGASRPQRSSSWRDFGASVDSASKWVVVSYKSNSTLAAANLKRSPGAVTSKRNTHFFVSVRGDAHTKSGRLTLVIAFGWSALFGVHLVSKKV
jgi:hypothetical protein